MLVSVVRGPERRPGRRCCHERPGNEQIKQIPTETQRNIFFLERRFPRPRHVCPIPALLGLLRVLRRNPRLPPLDHVSVLHPVRLRGHGTRDVRLREGEAEMFPSLLSL